jgi:hypothetical protein
MRSRVSLFLVIATTGCLNEYHPEYHPVTTTTIVQNVSSPTTVITQNETTQHDVTASPPPITRPAPQIARNEIEPKKAQKSTKTSSCPTPPFPLTRGGIELGPNVAIGPGVYFGGDVYVKGDLIVGGTREHPQLLTQ